MTAAMTPQPTRRARLAELTAGLLAAPADLEVCDVTLDSREAVPGALFLACRGRGRHGAQFTGEAVARGARAVLYEPAPGALELVQRGLGANDPDDVFVAAIPDLYRHAGTIADRFFGSPSQALTIAGITGTNGKTTCAWLLAQALGHCGRPAAYMGTIGFGLPGSLAATQNTTADAVSIHRRLAAMRALGAEAVSMEVSSHALDQERVGGVRFHTAAFTNLTRDHLDYHGTMAAYAGAKARLFAWPGLAVRVINVDDEFGARLARDASHSLLIVTARGTAASQAPVGARQVRALRVDTSASGLLIHAQTSWSEARLNVPLIGDFNADNVLTVLAVLLAWDIPLSAAVAALESCRAAPGRMEAFGGRSGEPLAIVDYAHTPDALAKALRAARRHCPGRLRVVFGCGGDRDPGKRPIMGRIAAELADEVVLTDDNPRSESAAKIVREILAGIPAGARARIEHDRALAIGGALAGSASGDVVLVAGKGHEEYQIHGGERRPFSDQSVVRAALEAMRP
jgi:UDP-N-acetylmuramoyl-L-alanyl-D-glutamate--2,6-diaminopimelate ligase